MTYLEASSEALKRLGFTPEEIEKRTKNALKQSPFDEMFKTIPTGQEEETVLRHVAGFKWARSLGEQGARKRRDEILDKLKVEQENN